MDDNDFEQFDSSKHIRTEKTEQRARPMKAFKPINTLDSGLRCFPTSRMNLDDDRRNYYNPRIIGALQETYPAKRQQKKNTELEKVFPDRLYIDNSQKMNTLNKKNLEQVERLLYMNPNPEKHRLQHHQQNYNYRFHRHFYTNALDFNGLARKEYQDFSQAIRCPECKKNLKPQQLDTHESVCLKKIKCRYCEGLFSSYHLQTHERTCSEQNHLDIMMEFRRPRQQPQPPQPPSMQYSQFMNFHNNRRQEQEEEPENQMEDIEDRLNQEEQQNERKNKLINTEQIKQMLIIYKRQEVQLDQQCSICNQQKKNGIQVYLLPCTHSFHPDCLTPWLQIRSTCPNCKAYIRT